ncbi:hypothetical protein C8T65DRAFT_657557 [Cerioporus squamosus]|nr:hypothetical protein C8T65DRAFT_657557 [Cerioporus squamosus]
MFPLCFTLISFLHLFLCLHLFLGYTLGLSSWTSSISVSPEDSLKLQGISQSNYDGFGRSWAANKRGIEGKRVKGEEDEGIPVTVSDSSAYISPLQAYKRPHPPAFAHPIPRRSGCVMACSKAAVTRFRTSHSPT